MAARVIHFGVDDCYRLRVLRQAGYEIAECGDFKEFRAALRSEADADAVMLNDSFGSLPLQAIPLARSRTWAPIILFPNPKRAYELEELDLVVPSFTPPQEWLLDVANLIERSRAIRAQSQCLIDESARLRRAAAATRESSRSERRRSRFILETRFPSPFDPDPGSE